MLKTKLSYKNAKANDAKLLFIWANEPTVRSVSFYQEPIEWENHVSWLDKKLEDPNSLILLFSAESIPVGMVRIEKDTEAIIGISIDAFFRGKKLAAKMLKMACLEFWKNNTMPIFAYIKTNNIASIKSFEKAGFNFERNDTINNCDCFVYKIEKNAYRES